MKVWRSCDWALERNDPQGWLQGNAEETALIAEADGPFKDHLDRYKYPSRYDNVDPLEHRAGGLVFLEKLDGLIQPSGQLLGAKPTLADHAIFPFVRQFANNDRDLVRFLAATRVAEMARRSSRLAHCSPPPCRSFHNGKTGMKSRSLVWRRMLSPRLLSNPDTKF